MILEHDTLLNVLRLFILSFEACKHYIPLTNIHSSPLPFSLYSLSYNIILTIIPYLNPLYLTSFTHIFSLKARGPTSNHNSPLRLHVFQQCSSYTLCLSKLVRVCLSLPKKNCRALEQLCLNVGPHTA